jgi:hypothetical protein
MNNYRLLAYFFKNCKKQFRFLKSEYAFSSLAGMAHYERGRYIIEPDKDLLQIEYPFHAIVRYERDDVAFEIMYGDYHYALECFITYGGRYRFALNDLVEIIPEKQGNAPILFSRYQNVHSAPQVHHIRAYLETAHKQLSCYGDYLLKGISQDFLESALEKQRDKTEILVRYCYMKQKENACQKAAETFKEQDYKRAIMLYRPYKKDLSSIELRMLTLAISYLGH